MSEWAPFAVRRDGPAWKVGYSFIGEAGPKRGQVNHSAEGYWAGLYSALDGPLQKSWQLTVGYDRVEQHYPISAHCWHAGDVDDDGAVAANLDFIGVEFLGMAGEGLSPYQVDMAVRIPQWCAEQEGRSIFRRFDGWDPDEPGLWLLAEHNEVSDVPTACPSGRIPWAQIMRRVKEDDDMAAMEEIMRLREELEAVNRFQNEIILGQKAAIDYLAKIAVDHEKRIGDLETFGEARVPPR